MKEIKFRVWNTESKKIISHELIIQDFILYEELCHPVKRNVFMQYTGLKDKAGVEIYESDLLRYKQDIYQDEFLEVKFDDACFIAESLNDRQHLNNQNIDDLEVVGNIYENPKLLRDNK